MVDRQDKRIQAAPHISHGAAHGGYFGIVIFVFHRVGRGDGIDDNQAKGQAEFDLKGFADLCQPGAFDGGVFRVEQVAHVRRPSDRQSAP